MAAELTITDRILIPLTEIELEAVRSPGHGGQNVNKVASAIHLRFDAANSPSLPDPVRKRLLALRDKRVTVDGIVAIKVQESRSQVRNRAPRLSVSKRSCAWPRPRANPASPAVRAGHRTRNVNTISAGEANSSGRRPNAIGEACHAARSRSIQNITAE